MKISVFVFGFIITVLISCILLIVFNASFITITPLDKNESTSYESLSINSSVDSNNNSNNICESIDKPERILISSDTIFNNINWTRYSLIDKENINENRIAGPNSVINHTFILVSIKVNVKDPEKTEELYRQMAGIVIELRQLLGPNSNPEVWGKVNEIESYHVEMIPYDERIYATDHYHPQAYKNEIYLIPGDDINDFRSYSLINNSVIEN